MKVSLSRLAYARTFVLILLSGFLFSLSSCSDDSYLNAIPRESTAVVALNLQKSGCTSCPSLLQSLLHVNSLEKSGLDFDSRAYIFTAPDGSLGFCARLESQSDWKDFLSRSAGKRQTVWLADRRGCSFAAVANWVMGWNDHTLLAMGPVTPAAQAELQAQMARYLNQDEEEGFSASRMYARLDSIEAPMAMVAQVKALPQKFSAPFMLGAPKDADASQVDLAAGIENKEGILLFRCNSFSFNPRVDEALTKAREVYRPIKGTFVPQLHRKALFSWFVNVDGSQFLPLLQSDAGLQAMLAGINAAIDMDNILRSVDGDLTITIPSFSDNDVQLSMLAQLAHTRWTADIDYWKKSVPKGSSLFDSGTNQWCYQNGGSKFYFGFTPDKQFFSGTDLSAARPSAARPNPMPQCFVSGKRMVMILDLSAPASQQAMNAAGTMLEPLFGKVKEIVFQF